MANEQDPGRSLYEAVVAAELRHQGIAWPAWGDLSAHKRATWAAADAAHTADYDRLAARVEALATALREAMPVGHYGCERDDAECARACHRDEFEECVDHRPDISDDGCDAHPTLDERDAVCVRCISLDALAATPPADLTQHPAYRAGVEAGKAQGLKAAAKECARVAVQYREPQEEAESLTEQASAYGAEGAAKECATAIRALLDTKEVRDA